MASKIPNGKICYLEIPSMDIKQSASFYSNVFGWNIRTRSDGKVAFDDVSDGTSGSWVLNAEPHSGTGFKMYIMVDDVVSTLQKITAAGGRVVTPVSGNYPELIATFSDPSGNVFGIGQE